MKKTNGFSLMEMMVVLLIVSIVAAASAPMINKKIVGVASEKSPWVWTGESQNITYNPDGKIRTASIGVVNPPNNYSPRLFIKTPNASYPHISLQASEETPLNFTWHKNAIGITNTRIANTTNVAAGSITIGKNANTLNNKSINSIAIGNGANTAHANSANSIAIGRSANTTTGGNEAIAIGNLARVTSSQSIAIGSNAFVHGSGDRATAIGYNTRATGSGSIAIGSELSNNTTTSSNAAAIAIGSAAAASGANSMAIGRQAKAEGINSIAIGRVALAANDAIALGSNAKSGKLDVAIGLNANATRRSADENVNSASVAIGMNARTTATDAIAIGHGASATEGSAIAIGTKAWTIGLGDHNTTAAGAGAVAIGDGAYASGDNSIAFGKGAYAAYRDSVAIGTLAQPTTADQIMLGTNNMTVYIPGNLVVGKSVYLNADDVYARTAVRPHDWADQMYVLQKDYRDGHRYFELGAGKTINRGVVSDKRLKNIGKAFTAGLDEIKKLELFNYTFKDDSNKTPRVGVMAQDLQKVFPNAVFKGDDGFLRIRMEDMFYALVNAVKELDAKIEALKNTEIATLKKQVQALEKENKALEKRLEALEKK